MKGFVCPSSSTDLLCRFSVNKFWFRRGSKVTWLVVNFRRTMEIHWSPFKQLITSRPLLTSELPLRETLLYCTAAPACSRQDYEESTVLFVGTACVAINIIKTKKKHPFLCATDKQDFHAPSCSVHRAHTKLPLCPVLKSWSPAVFCLRGSDYFKSPHAADLVSRLGTGLVFVCFPMFMWEEAAWTGININSKSPPPHPHPTTHSHMGVNLHLHPSLWEVVVSFPQLLFSTTQFGSPFPLHYHCFMELAPFLVQSSPGYRPGRASTKTWDQNTVGHWLIRGRSQ